MTRVLHEQHVAPRSASRRGRHGRRPRHGAGAGAGVRTVLLLLVVILVSAALVVLVPALEDASPVTGDDVLLASAPELPSLQDGLVDFELTEDVEYIIGEGETLSEIATRFEISYRELAAYNGLTNPDAITAGQRITIPGTFSRRRDPVE